MNEAIREAVLFRFAAYEPGWAAGYGEVISALALSRVDSLLASSPEQVVASLIFFPIEDGGVSMEYSDEDEVLQLEFTPGDVIELLHLEKGSTTSLQSTTTDLKEALDFLITRHPLSRAGATT